MCVVCCVLCVMCYVLCVMCSVLCVVCCVLRVMRCVGFDVNLRCKESVGGRGRLSVVGSREPACQRRASGACPCRRSPGSTF